MAGLVKTAWFGKQVSILMVNGKTVTGELSEVTDRYVVLTINKAETQVMDHAIVAVRLAGDKEASQ